MFQVYSILVSNKIIASCFFKVNVTNQSSAGDMRRFVLNGEWLFRGFPVRRHIITYPNGNVIYIYTRAAPDSPAYTFRPPPQGLHKSMTFQHGCPHHWKPPGRMYFYNTSIKTFPAWHMVNQHESVNNQCGAWGTSAVQFEPA